MFGQWACSAFIARIKFSWFLQMQTLLVAELDMKRAKRSKLAFSDLKATIFLFLGLRISWPEKRVGRSEKKKLK